MMCSTSLHKPDFHVCLMDSLAKDMTQCLDILICKASLLETYLNLYCCPNNSAKLFSFWEKIFFEYATIYDGIIVAKKANDDFEARMSVGKKLKGKYEKSCHDRQLDWSCSFTALCNSSTTFKRSQYYQS